MAWPWAFVELSADERDARRVLIDRYGHYAFLASLTPALVVLVVRVVTWLYRLARAWTWMPVWTSAAAYDAVPDSPARKAQRTTTRGAMHSTVRCALWWLADDTTFCGLVLGRRDTVLAGALYLGLLLVLSTRDTGRDYLHVTKRFGEVAMAQLPMQYVLACRQASPLPRLVRASHEQLNRCHRVLGAIVYLLVVLHSVLYLVFFYRAPAPEPATGISVFWTRLARPVVALGFAALASLTVLSTTALGRVRRWSYRVFFATHVAVALALPVLVFWHASHAQYYVASALLALCADTVLRKMHTVAAPARVDKVPGTDLLRCVVPVPRARLPLFTVPGAHVYLSLPHAARPTTSLLAPRYWLYELLFNPFTVAAVDDDDAHVTLVVHARHGPISAALVAAADADDADADGPSSTLLLNLEGPYGSSAYFPDLVAARFDRVLLVAGGVGATFAVPLFRAITRHAEDATETDAETDIFRPGRVQLVWSVRSIAEAQWTDIEPHRFLHDPHVHVFETGTDASTHSAELEMTTLQPADGIVRRRPDLRQIVDDLFRHGAEERVAVLVCGPDGMAQDLRRAVGVWVHRGRSVWWHNESFSW